MTNSLAGFSTAYAAVVLLAGAVALAEEPQARTQGRERCETKEQSADRDKAPTEAARNTPSGRDTAPRSCVRREDGCEGDACRESEALKDAPAPNPRRGFEPDRQPWARRPSARVDSVSNAAAPPARGPSASAHLDQLFDAYAAYTAFRDSAEVRRPTFLYPTQAQGLKNDPVRAGAPSPATVGQCLDNCRTVPSPELPEGPKIGRRSFVSGLGEAVVDFETDGRPHTYVSAKARVTTDGTTELPLYEVPSDALERTLKRQYVGLMRDLPRLAAAMGTLGHDRFEGMFVRDGQLTMFMSAAQDAENKGRVMTARDPKTGQLVAHVLWKGGSRIWKFQEDGSVEQYRPADPDEDGEKARLGIHELDRVCRKEGGDWRCKGRSEIATETEPKGWGPAALYSKLDKATGLTDKAWNWSHRAAAWLELVDDPAYIVGGYAKYGIGLLAGDSRTKIDALYTKLQAPLNAFLGDPSLATAKEIVSAYDQALDHLETPADRAGFLAEVRGQVIKDRRRLYGDLCPIYCRGEIRPEEMPAAAANLFGLKNFARVQVERAEVARKNGQPFLAAAHIAVGGGVMFAKSELGGIFIGKAMALQGASAAARYAKYAETAAMVAPGFMEVAAGMKALSQARTEDEFYQGVYAEIMNVGLLGLVKGTVSSSGVRR